MKRYIKSVWEVYGEYGGEFSRLEDDKRCAKEASTTEEYDYQSSVWKDGSCYIDYANGKLVEDRWTLPRMKKTGRLGKFKFGDRIVEKQIYLTPDGKEVIKHDNKIYTVNHSA